MLPKKYNKFDKIVISDNKDIDTISKWVSKNFNAENGAFPLEKGILEINAKFGTIDATSYSVFELQDDRILFDLYDSKEESLVKFESVVTDGKLDNKIIEVFSSKNKEIGLQHMAKVYGLMNYISKMFLQVMYFMANFIEDEKIIRDSSEQKNIASSHSSIKGIKGNKRKIGRKVYHVIANKDVLDKRKYERHAGSWSRRGHWRYLKSGKKVWIKPATIKVNKEDGEESAREYRM